MGHQAIIVHAGVALVHRHGIAPMSLLDRPQSFCGKLESLVPANRLPLVADTSMGLAQAIGVFLDILQGDRLGADMPTAE